MHAPGTTPCRPRGAHAWLKLALTVLVCAAPAARAPALEAPAADPVQELPLSSEFRIRVEDGRLIELLVWAQPGETYHSLARRVAGDPARASLLRAWNDGAELRAHTFVHVPLSLLSDEFRYLVFIHLFPEDRREDGDWIHVAKSGTLPVYNEGMWQVAEWFAGDGNRFEELMAVNGLKTPDLEPGREIRIPGRLLHPAFRPRARSEDGSLEYGEDATGSYAGYRLKPGEALYSSVVVRFTGRTAADDVNALARDLAERSGVRDLTDIPVGYLIKIPYEVLEPEFLPPGHPRRVEAEAAAAAMQEALRAVPQAEARAGLKGVVVILDPGHGGRDLGTMNNGLWEHDYVYDVACRLKQKIETRTQARVVMTLEDRETRCRPSTGDKLRANRQGTILTTPPFLARNDGEARIAVNLRWYLANSVYRKARKEGVASDRVVFLSLHADARHPSLRGVMVYVPGTRLRAGTYGHTSRTYRKFQEVREKPTVQFSYKSRIRSEAISRKLADRIVKAFHARDLPVQPYKPVRDRIIRGRRQYVPAVLRGNAVPTKVLVEMVNLRNKRDASLLASRKQRDVLAEALLDALLAHYGEPRSARR